MQPHPSGQTPPVAWSTTEAFHADPSRYAHSRELAHALRSIRYCKVETFRGCALGTIHIPPKEANGPSLSFGFYETEEGLTLLRMTADCSAGWTNARRCLMTRTRANRCFWFCRA